MDMSWQGHAACRGLPQDWFFLQKGDSQDEEKKLPGLDVCRDCPVKVDCLRFAIRSKSHHGIWGGKTTEQRKKVRKRDLERISQAS